MTKTKFGLLDVVLELQPQPIAMANQSSVRRDKRTNRNMLRSGGSQLPGKLYAKYFVYVPLA
jgi:hypothetical protein